MITAAQVQKRLNKADKAIADILSELESLQGEMEEAFEEKSEKWQESEKGEEWNNIISGMDDVSGHLTDAQNTLQEHIS